MLDIEDYHEEVNEVTEHKSTILKRRVRRFGSSERPSSMEKTDKKEKSQNDESLDKKDNQD